MMQVYSINATVPTDQQSLQVIELQESCAEEEAASGAGLEMQPGRTQGLSRSVHSATYIEEG